MTKRERMDEVRDERGPGWFWSDNEIIDEFAAKIGVHALAVYMALCRYSRDGKCFPSLTTLEKVLGVSRPSVIKAVATLRSNGLIRTEERKVGKPGHKVFQSTLYTIRRVEKREGVVNDIDYPSKADLPPVVNDVYPNKTKLNKTTDARDAVMLSLGIRADQRRKVLAARPDLTLHEIQTWHPFIEAPPSWCKKPAAYAFTSLLNGDPVPEERTNGKTVDIDHMTSLQIQALVNGHYE